MKKTLTLILAAVLSVGILGGCGAKKETEIKQDANGKYVPEKMLELTVWETQGEDYAKKQVKKENIVAQWLEEKTKVKIDNIYGNDGGLWDTKLDKLVAGDNLPDIVHCGAFQGSVHFKTIDEYKAVYHLTPELLQKYAPNLWARTPAEYWEKLSVDGKILGIPLVLPTKRESFPNISDETWNIIEQNMGYDTDVTVESYAFLWIRDDVLKMIYPDAMSYDDMVKMLEETGKPLSDAMLDIPIHSTQEFIDFMYKIQKLGLKEDGKTVYPFGYAGGDNWLALCRLGADMYGYKHHYYTSSWNSKKQKMEIPLVHDVIKAAAKTQNQMLADKVIDPESFAHTNAIYKEKILNGNYAIVSIDYAGKASDINAEIEKAGKSFRYRPFITQVPAHEEYGPYTEDVLWQESICLINSLSEAEVIQILNWIDVQYSDEFEQIRVWGPPEAGLYTENEEGKRVFKDERFNEYFIEGKKDNGLTEEERMGLGEDNYSLMKIVPANINPWRPSLLHNKMIYTPDAGSGFKFTPDSEHVKVVKKYPPAQVWSAVYADIPEVSTYWGEREQWESQFTMAIVTTPDKFETKWQEAVDYLNSVVDIATLENKMTEVAKPLAEALE